MPEIGWFSSTREESTGRGGPPPESLGITDLALCLRVARGHQVREPGGSWRALRGPSRSLPLMKTSRFLADLPSFSATEVRRGSDCAGERACRAEQRRAGESARSTGLRAKVGPGGRSSDRGRASGSDRTSDADSARAESCTRALCRYSPRLGRRLSE